MLCRGRSRSPLPRLRGWLVVAALVGLFSMHGLASHGVSTGHGASVEVGSVTAAVVPATSGHATSVVTPAAYLEPPTSWSLDGMGAMDMTGMVGCLVVLLAAGLLLCAARAPGSFGVRRSAAPCAVAVRALHRMLPPPDLVRLGVCRC